MSASMPGVHMIIPGPRCYMWLKDIISAEIGWNAICGQLKHMKILSRMGFLTQLKCKKVGIVKGKMSWMIIKEKLSERAVVKEDRLG